MKRRLFLQGIPVIGVCAGAAMAGTARPTTLAGCGVVGDGIHDDTAALQRALDAGIPVCNGNFRTSSPLHVRSGNLIVDNTITGGTIVLDFERCQGVVITGNYFKNGQAFRRAGNLLFF